METKKGVLLGLMQKMGPKETKFLIRFILKNMKVKASEAIMEMSLAQALCQNFHANRSWYTEKALPVCLRMLELDPSSERQKDVTRMIEKFRSLGLEDRIRFQVAYFRQMEEFRRSHVARSEVASGETVNEWVEKVRMQLSQYPFHQNMIETFLLLGEFEDSALMCQLTPGIPCRPMLAKPTRAIQEIFSRFEGKKFTCEYKYDGLRGQVHFFCDEKTRQPKIELFSRNLEDMTEMYQDLVAPIELWAEKNQLSSFIIDAEIMAYDAKSDKILPFQILTTRSRKKDQFLKKDQVEVRLYVFDVLYLNRRNLLLKSFEERRNELGRLDWSVAPANLTRADFKDLENLEEVQKYLEESVTQGCEGLMVKTLEVDATYLPSRRTFKWLKLKKDYLDNNGLGDSFDLVVLGASWGEGKRTGKFGTFLVASYNDAMDTFESCCKVGTGFSDEDLTNLHSTLKEKVREEHA